MADQTVDIIDQPDRAEEKLRQGGEVLRHFSRMVLDMSNTTIPAIEDRPGFTLNPLSLDRLSDYAQITIRAYAGDHVDHQPEDDDPAAAAEIIRDYLTRGEPWPLHRAASAHVEQDNGRIAGFVVVCAGPVGPADSDSDRPGTPWITEIAVDPSSSHNGVGTLMLANLTRVLAAEGHTEVGLAVTVGNPAAALYVRFGFRASSEVWRIRLPDR